MTLSTEGGSVMSVTDISDMNVASGRAGRMSRWVGTMSVMPATRLVNISETDASKHVDANCRTLVRGVTLKSSHCAGITLHTPRCATIKPLGRPVEPEV